MDKQIVSAENVKDFIARYYRRDRLQDRGEEYTQTVIKSHEAYFLEYGYTLISRHESNTGQAVWYYGDK